MMSAIVTAETHDYDICEIGDVCSDCVHFSREETNLTGQFETYRVIFKSFLFIERFSKVNFSPNSLKLFFHLSFKFFLSIFNAISHFLKFIKGSSEIADFHLFVKTGSKRVLNVGISAWISDLDCEGKLFSINVCL